MPTAVNRDRTAKIYVITEIDDEDESFIDSVAHEEVFALKRLALLKQRGGRGMVETLRWDYCEQAFVMQEPEGG